MSNEQKKFEARLNQVRNGLEISSEEAIKRMGDGMTNWNEFVRREHQSLDGEYVGFSLYTKARKLDERYGGDYTQQVIGLIQDIGKRVDTEISSRVGDFIENGALGR